MMRTTTLMTIFCQAHQKEVADVSAGKVELDDSEEDFFVKPIHKNHLT